MTILKKLRLEKNLTKKEVSNLIGIKVRHYHNVENGKSFLSQQKLNQLEDLFKLPQRILFSERVKDIPEYLNVFTIEIFGTD